MDSTRLAMLHLSAELVEEAYGRQESDTELLRLIRQEFPEDDYTMDDLIEMNQLRYEEEELLILNNHTNLW